MTEEELDDCFFYAGKWIHTNESLACISPYSLGFILAKASYDFCKAKEGITVRKWKKYGMDAFDFEPNGHCYSIDMHTGNIDYFHKNGDCGVTLFTHANPKKVITDFILRKKAEVTDG